jgi:hypothetical protein
LRFDSRLWDLAGDRAARMASTGIMSHSVAGSLSASLSARGIQRYSSGEDIGYSTAARGLASTNELFNLWRASSSHWALMMSSRYNYVGVGLAFRSRTGQTFGSIVFVEARDHTRPVASIASVVHTTDYIRWTWTGRDFVLQTHTAGVATYRVQIRVDGGAWRTVVSATRATARTMRDLARGHRYSLRVRATDKAGNVGAWTAESRVWLP